MLLLGAHTGVLILNEFDQVAKDFVIEKKVSGAVTDNAANMIAAMNLSIPGFDSSPDGNLEQEFLSALIECEESSLAGLLMVSFHAVLHYNTE